MNQTSKFSVRDICYAGLFAAVIAVMAQISIPMPLGVPMTMQTFAITLAAVVLGSKLSAIATLVYLLLGAVGVPVLANFSGGIDKFVGPTGGFLISFHFLQPTGCGGQGIEAKVQDYLARYDVPAREAIDVRWAQTCMALEDTVEQLEAVLSPVLVRRMQAKLWQALYFGYDYAQDYLPQLEANLQTLDMELHKLTEYQKKRNNSSK